MLNGSSCSRAAASCVGVTCGANIHNTQCSRHPCTPHLVTPHHTAPHHYPNLTSNHRRHHCRAQATERWATQLRHQSALWAPYHAPLRGESPTETDGYLGACAWRVRERERDVGRQTWPLLGCLLTALASCLTPGALAMLWAPQPATLLSSCRCLARSQCPLLLQSWCR